VERHSISGEWRGRYQHDGAHPRPSEFTAFISETSGSISGTIVDDGAAGKATLTGSFSFPSVEFSKTYVKEGQSKLVEKKTEMVPKGELNLLFFKIKIAQKKTSTTTITETFRHPVEYEGSMSEDGQTMSGKWKIAIGALAQTGTWTASRAIETENAQELVEKASRMKVKQLDEPVV
jgi:hypothetical protein